jgi:DNA-directed RNA polymerase subunit RPC12/RpoP
MNSQISCTHCSAQLQLIGEEDFRVGGASGFAGMFLGGLNQLSERTLALQMYRCPQCGHVEFFLPGA